MAARPIIVLGADGYLGWPLSLRLARDNPDRPIILVDNFLRRRLVRSVGGESILPVLEMQQRLWACRRIYGLKQLEFIQMDVNSDVLSDLVKDRQPAAVYHLAQQCSAPYSMRSCDSALFTLRNNEESNLRLLWAVHEYVPDCHVVKLGSFGEYAKGGLDIAEGYFRPQYRGRRASEPLPYPRQSDDFYHASKINDTNYISVACRVWGLRVTDIMQSTVFGTWTEDIAEHGELLTRFDYDESFGTVVNRFMAQALCGLPLTVYGSGHQRTGLMALRDSIGSLASLWPDQPEAGSHRVINHVTETSFSINELADCIHDIARAEGFPVTVQHGVYDPRNECPREKMRYEVECNYVNERVRSTDLVEVVRQSFAMLVPYRRRINAELFAPTTLWSSTQQRTRQEAQQARDGDISAVVVPLERKRVRRRVSGVLNTEQDWDSFRQRHFPYEPLNLNPGMLGSPSDDVITAVQQFQSGEVLAEPLQQYQRGRDAYKRARNQARKLWPSKTHDVQLVGSATQTSNLLALALAKHAVKLGRPLRLLTTVSEHVGGIGAFERMKEFRISYLSEQEQRDEKAFKALVAGFRPDVGLFSQIAYDTGHVLPVATWSRILKEHNDSVWTLIDVSQSLGIESPSFDYADVVFGSCHKWLFGPRGTGLLWTNAKFREWVGALNWAGEPLSPLAEDRGFSPSGGLDFSQYAGLEACFRLYRQLGPERARERSAKLALYFRVRLANLLKSHGIKFRFLEPHWGKLGDTGMFTVSFLNLDPYPLYASMNEHRLHCKCIKGRRRDGVDRQLLRFGFPCYETESRLRHALAIIEDCLREYFAQRNTRGTRYLENGSSSHLTYQNL